MNRYDGGLAFPSGSYEPRTEREEHPYNAGMTLRDYFAGQALTGLLAADTDNTWSVEAATKVAYKCADAMLEAREAE